MEGLQHFKNHSTRELISRDQVPPADDKNRYEKEYQVVANQKLRLEASTSELQKKLTRVNEELKLAK